MLGFGTAASRQSTCGSKRRPNLRFEFRPGRGADGIIRIHFAAKLMLFLSKPDERTAQEFLESQRGSDFSYAEVRASNSTPPTGYNVDHNRIRLGHGRANFGEAIEAIRNWKMFDFDWIELFPKRAPIETGATVAIAVRHFGFYSL